MAVSDLVDSRLHVRVRVVGLFLGVWLGTTGAGLRNAHAESVLAIDFANQRAVLPLRVAFDADDDDEDGVRDREQSMRIEGDELAALRITGGASNMSVRVEGGLRLILGGTVVQRATVLRDARVQGVRVSLTPGDAAIVLEAAGKELRVPVTVVGLSWLDAQNRALDPSRASLGVSRRITHDRSLPREVDEQAVSDDPENVRIEVDDLSAEGSVLYAGLLSRDQSGAATDALRHLPLFRVGDSSRFRSSFLRLVSDATDKSAPEVQGQLLKVRIRDRVAIQLGDARAPLSQDMRVGAPGRRGGDRAGLRGTLRVSVLRFEPNGATVVGENDLQAQQLSREQVRIANEIWAQCFIDFGRPEDAEVRIVDPPPPALLAIGDGDGLPAMGDGEIWMRVANVSVGPVRTRAGATPEASAKDVAKALERAGFKPELSLNPKTESGAGSSADLTVRNRKGSLVTLSVESGHPLSTDSRQRVEIGRVDLKDGIQEFDNDLSAAGTLEERTLIKLVADTDPSTIDIILINHFVSRERQGEAFIESDVSSTANTLLFDRNAVRYQRQAWVQAHELGHVLMDEPFHPDNLGPDRPYLLMDSDARQGRVTGPKRLSDAECKRARRRSGPGASPVLLKPSP